MGCCFSRKSSPSSATKIIRIVHLNGSIEDYDYPVTVCEVTGKSQKHFVCNHFQLLSACSSSLTPETRLERGEFYFLLPYTVLQSAASPEDFALIAKKLTIIAKSTQSTAKSGNRNSSRSIKGKKCPSFRSPTSSPVALLEKNQQKEEPKNGEKASKSKRSWKPILATIREKSFNRRSESFMVRSEQ